MNRLTDLSDKQQRRQALDPNRSFVVQAPAGSGKTGLLVRRYLALLARVQTPEEILAITFTRKATAEMASRILDALQPQKADSDADQEITALALAVRERDEEMQWNLAKNPARLRIQTIDAFCLELVRCMPWSARFGATPRILDNEETTEFYSEAARKTLSHIEEKSPNARHVGIILELVNAQFSRARSLLAQMLTKRDLWLRGINIEDRSYFERMWGKVIEDSLQRLDTLLDDGWKQEFQNIGQFAAENLAAEDPARQLFEPSWNNHQFVFPQATADHLEVWRDIRGLLFTKQGAPRKSWNKNQGFPPGSNDEKALIKRLLDQLLDRPDIVEQFVQIDLLPGAGFNDNQWAALDALLHVLPLAAAELRLLFSEHNVADYAEVTQRAEMALGSSTTPTDLAVMMDQRVSHLLMDEVQDTSRAHLDIISRLIADWTEGDGRTAFFVGDPMQSIYRFREADVGNFLSIQQTGIARLRPESLTLESNFRSSGRLVQWFNATFKTVFPENNDLNDAAVKYQPSVPVLGAAEDSGIRINGLVEFQETDQADRVRFDIARLLQSNPHAEIGVLGRSRRHLFEIAESLNRSQIAFNANELESLDASPAIQDLMALTRALIHPADRIAWLAVLRAPWCGLCLADLTTLAANDRDDTITNLARLALQNSSLSDDGTARILRFLRQMELPLKRQGRISLRNNLQSAWIRLGGPSLIRDEDIEDCELYFELLDDLDKKPGLLSADALHFAVTKLWSKHDSDASVQLMTIHKAKGLEFEYVFIPFLEKWSGQTDNDLLQWARSGDALLTATISRGGENDDRHNAYLRWIEKRRSKFESCRLLYVACTRAKNQLHLYASLKEDGEQGIKNPDGRSLLNLVWPALDEQFTSAPLVMDQTKDGEEKLTKWMWRTASEWNPKETYSVLNNVKSRSPESAQHLSERIEFSWAGETLRVTGVAIHYLLQWLGNCRPDWQLVTDEIALSITQPILLEHGLPSGQIKIASSNILLAVQNMKEDSRAKWLFSEAHTDIEAEWPLTAKIGSEIESIVIDRSFKDGDGRRWIIDFKSSRHDDQDIEHFLNEEKNRYSIQMAKYANVVSLLGPEPIYLGLYFPLLKGWIEWLHQ